MTSLLPVSSYFTPAALAALPFSSAKDPQVVSSPQALCTSSSPLCSALLDMGMASALSSFRSQLTVISGRPFPVVLHKIFQIHPSLYLQPSYTLSPCVMGGITSLQNSHFGVLAPSTSNVTIFGIEPLKR